MVSNCTGFGRSSDQHVGTELPHSTLCMVLAPQTLHSGTCTTLNLPLVSREWKNGSYSSYDCTPFLRSLLTKGQ